jgi:hypothetical protein
VYERCLDEAEKILASDKDIIVAVKRLWSEVARIGEGQGFEVPKFPDFSAMLEGDPRFEFLPFHKSVTEDLEDPAPDDDSPDEVEMEQLGFFSGDRVKLRNVKLNPQLLGTIIRSKVDRTMNALTKAWEARPEGDRETEDRLLEILASTQKLQREVKKTFSNERMARLEESLAKAPKSGKRPKSARKKPAARRKTVSKKPPARKVRSPKKVKTGKR